MPRRIQPATDQDSLPEIGDERLYASAKTLSARWECSISSVHRYLAKRGVPKLMLGSGANGMVRYRWSEVLRIEAERTL